VLLQQYDGFEITSTTQANIDSLTNENTFTVTTGHQLNIFTGPLYFIYNGPVKIFSLLMLFQTHHIVAITHYVVHFSGASRNACFLVAPRNYQ